MAARGRARRRLHRRRRVGRERHRDLPRCAHRVVGAIRSAGAGDRGRFPCGSGARLALVRRAQGGGGEGAAQCRACGDCRLRGAGRPTGRRRHAERGRLAPPRRQSQRARVARRHHAGEVPGRMRHSRVDRCRLRLARRSARASAVSALRGAAAAGRGLVRRVSSRSGARPGAARSVDLRRDARRRHFGARLSGRGTAGAGAARRRSAHRGRSRRFSAPTAHRRPPRRPKAIAMRRARGPPARRRRIQATAPATARAAARAQAAARA